MKTSTKSLMVLPLIVLLPSLSSARPFFTISPNLTTLNLQRSAVSRATFTVTNSSGVNLSGNITYTANIQSASASFQSSISSVSGCGTSLASGASCTLVEDIQATSTDGSGTVTPRVCFGNNCSTTASGTGNLSISVSQNPTTAEKYVYVGNLGNSTISLCSLTSTGALTACRALTPSTISQPISIRINAANTIAYISNANNTMSVCALNADATFGSCSASNPNSTFSSPGLGGLNAKNTQFYVPNFGNNTVSVCSLNADGTLNLCSASNPNSIFSSPNSVVLNSAETFLYVTNYGNNTVAKCSLNSSGTLNTCTSSNPGSTFSSPSGVSINAAGTFLYVNNAGTNKVSVCPINSDGTLGTCTASNPNSTFTGIGFGKNRINSAGTFLYVAQANSNIISQCSISSDGSLGTCVASTENSTFSTPQGIDFNMKAS